MRISAAVEAALATAADEATSRRHEYVTLEHLLYGLLVQDEIAELLRHLGNARSGLLAALKKHLQDEVEQLAEERVTTPVPTLGVHRVLRLAMAHVESSGKELLQSENVLVAMFSEEDSLARALLEQNGIHRLALVSHLSHGRRPPGQPAPGLESEGAPSEGEDGAQAGADPLAAYTLNLNDEARAGRIDLLVGRQKEVERIVQVLARRRKNNPVLVGDSGVGKTAIVEGLARRIVEGSVPHALRDATVYSVDMGALLAGTQFRGQFEERMKALVQAAQAQPGAILFIDEIHSVIGAGSTRSGASDASSLLKPALTSGRLRCIGSTTFDEYRRVFLKDTTLSRRFLKVDIEEPSVADTIEVLKGLRAQYEAFHGVRFHDDALTAAAELSAHYLHDRKLPDKALDLLDEAGAAKKLAHAPAPPPGEAGDSASGDAEVPEVSVSDVETVLATMAHIPPREVQASERERLRQLEPDLKQVVFGQERAIEELVSAIKLSRAGLRSPEKPIGSFLLSGPTGVGKTEVAKQLAKTLGIGFVRIDMSEYMERHSVSRLIGAPPGYVGFEQAGLLTDAVAKTPHTVLLLDEIEKAHPDVFNILLQVMDHGKLTDNNGKSSDFRHVVLLMTSNVGARDLVRRSLGFQGGSAAGDAEREFRRVFTPEFRNRLDARIQFAPLSPAVMGHIVDKFLGELRQQLTARQVELELSDAAKAYLAREGYDADMGARPLGRVIQERVKVPLSEQLLFGALEHGGRVTIDVEPNGRGGEQLAFVFHAAN